MATEDEKPLLPSENFAIHMGGLLAHHREAAGYTQRTFGKRIRESQATIARWEKGKRSPQLAQAVTIDAALGTGTLFTDMQPHWLRAAFPSWFAAFVEMERLATEARIFESVIVPALFQTEAYARAMLATMRPDADRLEELVAARMARQEILTRPDRLRIWSVIDEQALGRQIGGVATHRAQLARLMREAEEPRTVIQVVPKHVGARPALAGAFTVIKLPSTAEALYTDAFHRGHLTADPSALRTAHHAYDLLTGVALSPHESLELMRKYHKETPHDPDLRSRARG